MDEGSRNISQGYMGHTMGACGAIEAIASLLMMREGFMASSLNLEIRTRTCRR